LKKLLFYDLDGTLVDTREDIACAANHMLRQMNKPELAHDEIAGYVGRGVFHLISGCLKTQDVKTVEKGTKIYRTYYGEHMLDHSKLFPGVLDMLKHFQARAQVVLTNKPNPFSYDLLKALGTAEYFKEVIAGDSVYPKKPDPGAVWAMMEKFGASAADSLFIGDSLVDIETARNAKIAIAVVTHGFSSREELQSASPDLLAGDFGDLLRQMKAKGW
jgi:phosphoglycolate phosphatase